MAIIEISTSLDCTSAAPVRLEIPPGVSLPDGPLQLRADGGGEVIPAQRDGNEVVALVSGLRAGEKRRYHLEAGTAAAGVTLRDVGDGDLEIVLPEGPFTTYHYGPERVRPFFYPVLAPGGVGITRNYPMQPDVPGETKDHPHHKSFFSAYGEVNGTDDWSEETGHGYIRHGGFESQVQGPVFGGFTAAAVWTTKEGKPLLDELRTIRVYNVGADRRLLDYELQLTAAYEDIHYGDTKEAGLLAFRVATSMDGNKGGRIENSLGGVTEKECWGKRAAWLDYSGTVDGQIFGIGMMDHPGNLHHPCYWHARDYGLVGTNPFASHAFGDGEPTGWRQARGETLRFRYRVLIHTGTAADGHVDEAYHAWVQGPAAAAVG